MSAVDDTRIDEKVRAIRFTAEKASETDGMHLRIEPAWPIEPAPKSIGSKPRKHTQPQSVVSAAVPHELRLRLAIEADTSGTTISEVVRNALAEHLRRPPTESTGQAVRVLAHNAAADDSYRTVLIHLAAEHGGMYLEAVKALYPIELRTLGRWEALARLVLDQGRLAEARTGRDG